MANNINPMEERRQCLSSDLHALLSEKDVFICYCTPESTKIRYPMVMYERCDMNSINADNVKYFNKVKYRITVVETKSAPSDIAYLISTFKNTTYETHYVKNGLHYDVFTLYY